jgi:hypothetical protein
MVHMPSKRAARRVERKAAVIPMDPIQPARRGKGAGKRNLPKRAARRTARRAARRAARRGKGNLPKRAVIGLLKYLIAPIPMEE